MGEGRLPGASVCKWKAVPLLVLFCALSSAPTPISGPTPSPGSKKPNLSRALTSHQAGLPETQVLFLPSTPLTFNVK